MVKKALFIKIIENLREQYDYDVAKADLMGKVLDVEDIKAYDNSKLTESIFSLLQLQFPPDKEGCEIQRFCYDLNFGRSLGETNALSEYGAIMDLWDYLNSQNPKNIAVEFEEIKPSKEVDCFVKTSSKAVKPHEFEVSDNDIKRAIEFYNNRERSIYDEDENKDWIKAWKKVFKNE